MKNLARATVVLAWIAAPQVTLAEIQPLSDETMSNLTGQAGISIDFHDFSVELGEINYKDEGNLFITGFHLGGAGIAQEARGEAITEGRGLDNGTWVIDIAGATNSDALENAWGYDGVNLSGPISRVVDTGGNHGQITPDIDDGDFVLQARLLDENHGADFGILIDRITLGTSDLVAGDDLLGKNTGTVLASDIVMSGWLGPYALVIDESENNLNISFPWESTMDVNFDFIATKMQIKMHNSRGNDQLVWAIAGEPETASFFHVQADIGAMPDNSGLKLNITDYSGDIDFTDITFGSNPAAQPIGAIYLTDMTAKADMVIYGH